MIALDDYGHMTHHDQPQKLAAVIEQFLAQPKGTPKPVIDKLVAALQAAVQDPTFKSRLADLGAQPVPVAKANPEALLTFLKAEIDKWGPIIKKGGVYAD